MHHEYVTPMTFSHWLFRFKGRISRSGFWTWALLRGLISIILLVLFMVTRNDDIVTWLLVWHFGLSLYPDLAVGAKRLHDLNRPGSWIVAAFIPPFAIVLVIYLGFFRGTVGPNYYGMPPTSRKYWKQQQELNTD